MEGPMRLVVTAIGIGYLITAIWFTGRFGPVIAPAPMGHLIALLVAAAGGYLLYLLITRLVGDR